MKKLRYIALFVLLFLLGNTLCACSSAEKTPCREILTAMTDAEVGLPAGTVYDARADRDGDRLPSESLLGALYGNGKMPPVSDSWLDCALFLSLSEHPCEFAVFLCNSHDAAVDTARLLCSRLDVIKTLKSNGEYGSMLDGARVTVIKNYALLIISSDSDNAERVAKKTVG